jgi:hypothetical protein
MIDARPFAAVREYEPAHGYRQVLSCKEIHSLDPNKLDGFGLSWLEFDRFG